MLGANGLMQRLHSLGRLIPERHLGQIDAGDESDTERVVHVMAIVSEAVRRIDDLRFQQRLPPFFLPSPLRGTGVGGEGVGIEIRLHFRRVGAFAVHCLGFADFPR